MSLRPADIARELQMDPKRVRAWLRVNGWRTEIEKGQPWVFDREAADGIITGIRGHSQAVIDDALATSTVGELLRSYAEILTELKHRGLVRTSNAPIGDLAEYVCAVVYDGILAPNSEKSYDLIAADRRRVQVKVRNIREDTRPSSVFSPIRSFDFDVCAFLLVDAQADRIKCAWEWTTSEVSEHGVHRAHTNGTVIRVRQVQRGAIGTDITAQVDAAWAELLGGAR